MSEKKDPPPAYEASQENAAVEPASKATATTTGAPTRPPQTLRAPLPLNLPALNMIRGRRVVLASASPRRKQLLAQVSHRIHFFTSVFTPIPSCRKKTLKNRKIKCFHSIFQKKKQKHSHWLIFTLAIPPPKEIRTKKKVRPRLIKAP